MDSLNIKQSRSILEVEMKLLQGYVENRTKEAALAAIMLALFFVTRTYKITINPAFSIDFAGAVIYSAASVLSYPYTILFSLSTLYLGSNMVVTLAFFLGSQAVFFLSRVVGEKWVPHTVGVGQLVSLPSYGLLLHFLGLMDFRVYIIGCGIPALICAITAYIGGLLFWKTFRGLGVIE